MEINFKRFLSLMLALVMVIGMMPVGHVHVHAEEETFMYIAEKVTTVEENATYVICLAGTKNALTNERGSQAWGTHTLATAKRGTVAESKNMWTLERSDNAYKLHNANGYLNISRNTATLNETGHTFELTHSNAGWAIKSLDTSEYFNNLGDSGSIGGWSGDGTKFDLYKVVETSAAADPYGKLRGLWSTYHVDTETQNAGDKEGEFWKAFDNDPGTFWHSNWKGATDKLNGSNTFTGIIDLGATYTLNWFSYAPRQDGTNSGQVTRASVYVSAAENPTDNDWTVAEEHATFADDASEKVINFNTQSVRYVKFVAEQSDDGWVTASEFNVGYNAPEPEPTETDPAETTTPVETEGHKHNYVGGVTTPATCTEKGVMTYTCSCGEGTYTDDIAIDPNNHVNKVEVPGTPATLNAPGQADAVYCNDCQTTVSGGEVIPQLTIKNAKVLSNNNVVALSECEYVLGGAENAYSLSHGGTYYVKPAANGTVIPQTQGEFSKLTLAWKDNGSVWIGSTLAKDVAGGGSIHIWTAVKDVPYWDRCGNGHGWNSSSGTHDLFFFRADQNSTNAAIPGYTQVTAADVKVGESYLIAAKKEDGSAWYIMYPTASTEKFDHIAQIVDDAVTHTHEYTETVTPATCQATGLKTNTCSCGHVHTEVIPVDENAHNWTAADCVNPKTCSACGATEGEANGHTAAADDNNCETAVLCANGCNTVMVEAKTHVFDSNCTTADECQNDGCTVKAAGASAHVYDNDCADTTCANCAVTREAAEHVFDNDCTDTTCANCAVTREAAEHVFDNDCTDTTCANCAVTREAADHVYDDDCTDTTCANCAVTREAAEHVYDDDCTDTTCANCAVTREAADHVYDDDCTDTTCANCAVTREAAEHVFDNDCADTTCANCAVTREAAEHVFDNDCTTADKCANCDVTAESKAHVAGKDDGDCTTAVKCVNCEKNAVEAKDHAWGNWAETKPATLNEKGEERRDCDNCDAYETREIPMLTGAVASVNGYNYATLAEAYAAVKAGETLTLLADVSLSEILTVDKAITIDGNGKTLTSTAARAINIETTGTVKIENLTINADERAINIINQPATVTLDGVTATAKNNAVMIATSAGAANVTINNSDLTGLAVVNVAGEGAQVAIENTKITNVDANPNEDYGAITVWSSAEKAKVTVTGGSITVADDSKKACIFPANATVEGVDDIGYIVATVGDAGFYTLAEAVECAKAGDTVELVRAVNTDQIIKIEKAITINGNGKTLTSTAARAINIETTGTVKIENLTINADERAINIINQPATVTLDGVTATAKNNAVMIATSAGAANVTINNSDLTGLAVVNVAGAGAQVAIGNTEITNVDANPNEDYGAITVWSSAENAKVTVTGGSITVADDSKKACIFPANATVEGVDDIGYIVATVGDAGFYTLAEAVEYAKAGDTVELVRAVNTDQIIKIEKAITIDLNGKTVTSTAKKAFEVYADATIQNGTIVGANRCVDTRKAVELTLTDLTLVADNYSSAYGNPQPLTIGGSENGTVVDMTNVNISAKDGYGIITFVETELTAENSTISGYAALYVKPGSDNSEFNFVNTDLAGSTAGNDVEGNSFTTIAVRADNVTVNVDKDSSVTAAGNYCYAISLGGKVEGEESVTGAKVTVAGTIEGNVLSKASLSGNTVTVPAANTDGLNDEGYAYTDNADGTVTAALAVAKIGDTNYATLAEAFAAAKDGDTITLVADVVLDTYLNVTTAGKITLDLAGFSITRDDKTGIYVDNANTVLTITGEGKVSGGQAVWAANGTVKIMSGTYYGTGDAIYTTDNGHIEIYGGSFSAKDGAGTQNEFCVLNQNDGARDTSSITVYGGTFKGFNPADNVSEGADTNFVAEGYCSRQEGESWTVHDSHEWVDADCDTPKTCSACGATEGTALGHTPAEAVKENEKDATCTVDGSYDSVVYCSACDEELSRETNTVTATGHTAGEAVKENEKPATCGADGSYESVTYCSECDTELNRETIPVPATGKHTAGEAVKENETETGYDLVTRCTECGTIMSSEYVAVEVTKVVMKSMNVLLEDEIKLTYTIAIPEELVNAGASVVLIKDGAYKYVEKTFAGENLISCQNADGNYVVEMGVASGEMTCPITVKVLDAEGAELALHNSKNEVLGTSVAYSVVDYAGIILNGNSKSEVKALANALVVYGGYAQTNFDTFTETLAYDALNIVPDLSSVTATTVDQYKSGQTNANIGVKANGINAYLDSNIFMRVYMKVEGDIAGYSFTLTTPAGVQAVTPVYDSASNRYYVDITGIASAYIDYTYTVTATKIASGETNEITTSVLSYVRTVLNGNYTEKLQNLVKAIYLYNQAANANWPGR